MAGGSRNHSVDVLRKTVIVVVLVAALWLLHRFAVPSGALDPRGLLALGFVILAAFTVGELAETIRLPHITGYLLAGLALGPSAAEQIAHLDVGLPPPFDHGVLNQDVLGQLVLLDDLALALIALTAGGELRLEALRRGLRTILGILGAQALTIGVLVTAFVWAISGVIPAIALPQLAEVPSASAAIALGAVVAAIAFATSPAATIAIINGTGSKGPMTSTVLSVVVLKDVFVVIAFSAATAVATGLFGVGADGGFLLSLLHIAGSIALGVVLGLGLRVYLATVGAELLVFLVGTIYTATFVANAFHGEAALVFIVAGFVVANFSDHGETLIHEVERLALPVYVVFFTLAGAKLHLDVLAALAPFAVALFAVRLAAVVSGTWVGARLTGAPDATRRYGWMGFVSQAGLAITLATAVGQTYPGAVGEGLFALVLAGVALNEIAGPVLLQFGLGLAGERADQQAPADTAAESPATTDDDAPATLEWETDPAVPEPWGPPLRTAHAELDRLVADVERELRLVARDAGRGPLDALGDELEQYLRSLRREYLRFHRRMHVRIQNEEALGPVPAAVRIAMTELGDRWRDRVLDRSAALASRGRWSSESLVEPIDALAASLPEVLRAPVLPDTLEARDEALIWRTLRAATRQRARIGTFERIVILRDLAGYHLSGRLPSRLEGVSAVLIRGELHLADRTSALYERIGSVYGALARRITDGEPRAALLESLAAGRVELDEEFAQALHEARCIARDAAARTTIALGAAHQDLKRDLRVIGTIDLPLWRRRYSRVLAERSRGLEKLDAGWRSALDATSARYGALALELEVLALEGRVLDAVEMHAGQLARLVRGRGPTQLHRVVVALTAALESLGGAVTEASDGEELRQGARAALDPVRRLLDDALRATRRLETDLADEAYVTPLVDAMLHAAQALTDWYTVPAGRIVAGEWTLPVAPPTHEVAFRETAIAFVEAALTRDLLALTAELAGRVGELCESLEDLQRILTFNLELASSELEEVGGDALPESARELVQDLLVGAVGRGLKRLDGLAERADGWPDEAERRVRGAVVAELGTLRQHVLDGDLEGLRRLSDRREVKSLIAREADRIGRAVDRARLAAEGIARRALGAERVDDWRVRLGVPEDAGHGPLADALAPPRPSAELPAVYARLFSPAAYETGDLLAGRQREVQRLRDALALGGAAVVTWDTTSGQAVLNAAVRAVAGADARRVDLEGPATVDDVDGWFADGGRRVLVITCPEWLIAPNPGGGAPAARLAHHALAADHTVVLLADPVVWGTLATATALGRALPCVSLASLDVDDLQRALLARHAMSGFELAHDALDDLGWQPAGWMPGGDPEALAKRAWFGRLHAAAEGRLADALRLWLASIRHFDEAAATVHLGRVARPRTARLRGLPDDTALHLRQIARCGWTTVQDHARAFDLSLDEARATLDALHRDRLLTAADGRFRVPEHLRAPLALALDARGWAA